MEYNFLEFNSSFRIRHDWKLEDWIEYQANLIKKRREKNKRKKSNE